MMRGAGSSGERRIIKAAAVAAGAAAMTLVTAGSAVASWSPIARMTASRWEGEAPPAVAVSRNGTELLAWSAFNEDGRNGYPCSNQIQLRIRSRSGKLGPIRTLTPGCKGADWPAVAIDDKGNGLVAWVRSDSSAVQARRVSPTGKLGRLLTLTPKGEGGTTVAVAMSPAGQALAAWVGLVSGGSAGVQARYIGRRGTLGKLRNLGSAPFETPSVVISRTGVATVAWADANNSRAVARRLTRGSVGRLKVIMRAAGSTSYGVPLLADDGGGNTSLLVRRSVLKGTRQPTYLDLRRWSRAGKLGRVRHIARQADGFALATDRAGTSVAVWDKYVSSAQAAVYERRITRTGAVRRVIRLGLGFVPAATVDPAGAGMIAWQSEPANAGVRTRIFGRRFSMATGKIGSRFAVTGDGDYVRLAATWSGRFAAIWQQSTPAWPIRARFGS
jgi:hypothetical protein